MLLFQFWQKSVKKKRKKEKEGEIGDMIKKKKKQLMPEESKITFAHMAGIESLRDVSSLLSCAMLPYVVC